MPRTLLKSIRSMRMLCNLMVLRIILPYKLTRDTVTFGLYCYYYTIITCIWISYDSQTKHVNNNHVL